MSVKDWKCAASFDAGLLHLENGVCIDLDLVYSTLADLCAYAESATLEDDDTPQSVLTANLLLQEMEDA